MFQDFFVTFNKNITCKYSLSLLFNFTLGPIFGIKVLILPDLRLRKASLSIPSSATKRSIQIEIRQKNISIWHYSTAVVYEGPKPNYNKIPSNL